MKLQNVRQTKAVEVDPTLLMLPTSMIIGAMVIIATCYSASGPAAVRNDLIGIRLWSTMFSDEAWRAGHRAGIPYSWLLAVTAAVSLGVGIWLIGWDTPPADSTVSTYTLGTLVATLLPIGLMALSAHKAAKKVAVQQVLAQEGDVVDAIVEERYGTNEAH